jgi:membrane protein DedA with SNARE-associated domain
MTRAFLPFIAGSMGMKSGKFMLYNAIGSIIRATTIILL